MIRNRLWVVAAVAIGLLAPCSNALAQDDVTTQNASSAADGAWITGPASNPLSFLNGPAYRTFASTAPYDVPDFHPISTLNKHLPDWMGFAIEERLRIESYRNGNFKPGNDDSYLLNRFRYQIELRPFRWLKVVSQVQDARPVAQNPPHGPPNENRWDLKLAFVEAGDPQKQWISVRVGRQLINYNNTILANSEWRNQGRSYDAVTTNLHYKVLRLGVFAAAPVLARDAGVSHHQAGDDVFGLYGHIDKAVPRAALEPFVIRRTQSLTTGKQAEEAYGLRLKGKVTQGLDYSVEGIDERGTLGSNVIRAWGVSSGAAYRIDSVIWRPRLFVQYDFASGDRNAGDGVHQTFDTMYPTAHDRFGITDLFGWQNTSALRGGITAEPHRRWTVSTQYLNFSLASAADGLYNSSGGLILKGSTSSTATHIGKEVDVYTWYELNRHFNVGAGIGHLTPGAFLTHAASGLGYTYSYLAINFKDNGKTR